MIIREETAADHQAIHDLTGVAFAPMPFADDTDAALTGEMRAEGDLRLSLVADEDGVIGHVAFSDVSVQTPGHWMGLGPISVAPDRQRQGIGSALVRDGLARIKARSAAGCVLIGNPAVYGPMGFRSGGLTYRDLPTKLVQWISFSGVAPQGEVTFCPALEAQ